MPMDTFRLILYICFIGFHLHTVLKTNVLVFTPVLIHFGGFIYNYHILSFHDSLLTIVLK